MDIQDLITKLRLPSWLTGGSSPAHSNGFCCLTLLPAGFKIVYTRKKGDKLDLLLHKFIPCDTNALTEALTKVVEEYELYGVNCSLMLQPDHYQLLLIEELPVPPEEFQAAIRWKIKDLVPFPIANATIDAFSMPVANMPQAKKMMTVVVTQTSLLQPIANQINDSGLNLTVIDIPELALRNVSAAFENGDNSSALIYLQEKSSQVIITRQKNFYLSRRIEWGINMLADSTDDPEITNQHLDRLTLEIQRSFDYFQSQWRVQAPTQILLAPLKVLPIDIATYLSVHLISVQINLLDLNQIFSCTPKLNIDEQGSFLPLLGGALREEINVKTTTN